MRNKLPILLALVLTAVAAMPWLRSLELQNWNALTGPTTVPPPSPLGLLAPLYLWERGGGQGVLEVPVDRQLPTSHHP